MGEEPAPQWEEPSVTRAACVRGTGGSGACSQGGGWARCLKATTEEMRHEVALTMWLCAAEMSDGDGAGGDRHLDTGIQQVLEARTLVQCPGNRSGQEAVQVPPTGLAPGKAPTCLGAGTRFTLVLAFFFFF